MNSKTKILIITDSPALPTGQAETTRLVFGALLDRYPGQYELHQIGLFHCYAVAQPRWPVYPTATVRGKDGNVRFDPQDQFGQKTVQGALSKVKPDIVFAFGDPHRVLYLCKPSAARPYRLVLHLNFDGLPLPPGIWPSLADADRLIGTSEFSRSAMALYLPQVPPAKLDYIYSPADVERFKPVSAERKAVLRHDLLPEWMPPDAFVLGWIGRNQWRKQIWLLYAVIDWLRTGDYLVCAQCGRVTLLVRNAECGVCGVGNLGPAAGDSGKGVADQFCPRCGSGRLEQASPLPDVFLWMHTPDEPEECWPKKWLERQYDVKPGRDIYYTEGHELKASLAPADMPMLYQIWDCLLYLSGGEGFGLPAWEAMCSGLPAVYTRYSAHAELLGKGGAGLAIDGILQPEPRTCVWRIVADMGQAIEAVRRLYFNRELGRCLGQSGHAFVEQFTPTAQAERWHHVFQTALTRCAAHPPTR